MGKLIVIEPQKEPRLVEHEGAVNLEDIHRHIGADVTADVVRLGTIPPVGRHVDAWIDDEGLLKDDVLANRRLPNGVVIAGTIMICAAEGPKSVPLTDSEASFLMRDIPQSWEMLAADHPKPQPSFEIHSVEER